MAFSGAQTTRLGVSAFPRQPSGSFAGKGTTFLAFAAVATAVSAVQLKTKKTVSSVAIDVSELNRTINKTLASTATGVAVIAETLLGSAKETITAVATGIVAAGRKIKISLR